MICQSRFSSLLFINNPLRLWFWRWRFCSIRPRPRHEDGLHERRLGYVDPGPLGPGVRVHPVDDRVDAAVEDGGQVDDVLHQARHHLGRLIIYVFPDVI